MFLQVEKLNRFLFKGLDVFYQIVNAQPSGKNSTCIFKTLISLMLLDFARQAG